MNEIAHRFDLISMILFLGICQGFFLSIFFLLRKDYPNKYLGFLLLSFSLMILDYFYCYTYLMLNIVWILNYSESITFLIGPLIYLHIKSRILKRNNKYYLHFIPFLSYLLYYIFYLAQPYENKYNSYLGCWNIDLPYLSVTNNYNADPLAIGNNFMIFVLIHLLIYVILTFILVKRYSLKNKTSLIYTNNSNLKWIRDISIAFVLCVLTIIVINGINSSCTKVIPISIALSGFIYFISFRIIIASTFFGLSSPKQKYSKSGVSQDDKDRVHNKILTLFENEKVYMDNLISLPKLSKTIGLSVNAVSQVINEEFNMSFFELIAKYRINEAKTLLRDKNNRKLTILEIGEMVGYNSKSTFNVTFKKHTGMTPTEYRKSFS